MVVWAFAKETPAIAATSATPVTRASPARALRSRRHDEQRFMVIDETLFEKTQNAGGMHGVPAILAHS